MNLSDGNSVMDEIHLASGPRNRTLRHHGLFLQAVASGHGIAVDLPHDRSVGTPRALSGVVCAPTRRPGTPAGDRFSAFF